MGMESLVVDTQGAATRIGLSVATLEKKRVYGDGPPFLKLGRAVRYRIADLDAWVAARVVSSTSETISA
jgi:predicted DNA-binding transcriptional regulator AlpA